MYKIKSKPEDFIVRELMKLKFDNEGDFAYFKLKKKGFGTEEVMKIIQRIASVPLRFVNYSGLKDKHAVTEQYLSIRYEFAKRLKDLGLKDINFEYLGRGNERLTLGQHSANHFELIVRNLEKEPNHPVFVPNYFDEQRFSNINPEAGKHILKGEFKEAVELIINNGLDLEVEQHINKYPTDFVGALRALSLRTLKIYIHSYQALLFNKLLSNYVEHNTSESRIVNYSKGSFVFSDDRMQNTWLPLIGFGSDDLRQPEEDLLDIEGIKTRNFIIRALPEISAEGGKRAALIDINDLEINSFEDDELNKGKKKCKISFSLAPGSYATIVAKSIFA